MKNICKQKKKNKVFEKCNNILRIKINKLTYLPDKKLPAKESSS